MIRSMTGFGRGTAQSKHFVVRAEIRSVNNRNLRIACRLPDRIQGLDAELEKRIRDRLARGSVNAYLLLEDLTGDTGYVLDEAAIAHYRDRLAELSGRLGIAGEMTMDKLVTLPGVVRKGVAGDEVPDELVETTVSAVDEALDQLIRAREAEGKHMWQDILGHCDAIDRNLKEVEAKLPQMVEHYRQRTLERLQPLMEKLNLDISEEDIRKEIVLFADRSDVSEELTRLASHVKLMREMGDASEPCGRRLEFIAQEMFREANTLGSKAGDGEIIPDVVEIKSVIEKVREQALNVE